MTARDDWTRSPAEAVRHIRGLPEEEQQHMLIIFRKMMRGGDAGQIEPWGPSVRAVVYPEWTDADFALAVAALLDVPPGP